MNIIMNFHQLESTPAIKEVVDRKSQKLKKYFNGSFDLKWTMSAGKEGHHAHATLSGDGYTLNADSVKDDLYKTFDEVVSKLDTQLAKIKMRSSEHIHHRKNKTEHIQS